MEIAQKGKMLIVLNGDRNVYKTTSLIETMIAMTGISIDSKGFTNIIKKKTKNSNKNNTLPVSFLDARFIVVYKGLLIYISTAGDDWHHCKMSMRFFEGNYSKNMLVYKVSNNSIDKLTQQELSMPQNQNPDICICACRPTGDDYGAIKAIHSHLERHSDHFWSQLWLRKDKQKTSKQQASEIIDIIKYFYKL